MASIMYAAFLAAVLTVVSAKLTPAQFEEAISHSVIRYTIGLEQARPTLVNVSLPDIADRAIFWSNQITSTNVDGLETVVFKGPNVNQQYDWLYSFNMTTEDVNVTFRATYSGKWGTTSSDDYSATLTRFSWTSYTLIDGDQAQRYKARIVTSTTPYLKNIKGRGGWTPPIEQIKERLAKYFAGYIVNLVESKVMPSVVKSMSEYYQFHKFVAGPINFDLLP